ncbi:glycosyltransferase [Patescibacteria group bacterium]|nr:glycosyltransferase [Patescibacteria group bacterium]
MNYPSVTILIPIKNVAKYIKECLDALINQNYPHDKYEIWLLDNNSNDGTLKIVANYPKNKVRVIQTGIDSPPIKYNKILPSIKNEIIGLVDGDANVDKEWLKKTVEQLKDPKTAGATGVILTANSKKLIPRIIGYELQDRYEKMPKEIKRAATMHIVYKKKIIEEIGGFNEKLKTGYDAEIGHRINNAGYKIIFVKDAKVWHNHRETLKAFFKQQYEYGKFAVIRYLKLPKMLKGDEVSSFWMISQPLFYLSSIILLIFWFFYKFSWYLILIPILILFISYIFSTLRLTIKYKDLTAISLFIIYLIRPIGWTVGAISALFSLFRSI